MDKLHHRSSESATPKEDAVIRDDERWTEGDFELISSDGVRFRCLGVHVLASSDVFRSAADLHEGGKDIMAFTDVDIECAEVLDLYLGFIHKGSLGDVGRDLQGVKKLALFLNKWNCEAALTSLLLEVDLLLRSDDAGPEVVFLIAALVHNKELAAFPVQLVADDLWRQKLDPYKQVKENQSVCNPCYWSPERWDCCGRKCLAALARAWGETDGGQYEKLSTAFPVYLNRE